MSRARLIDRRVRPQPRNDLQVVLPPLLRCPARRERRPDVGREENLKARRDDADDREGLTVEPEDAADGAGIGVHVAAPEPFAHDDDGRLRHVVVGAERPAGDWRDAEHVEERRRHRLTGNALGDAAGAGQRPPAAGDGGHRRERVVLFGPVEEVERGDAVVRVGGRMLPEHHQSIGIGERQAADDGGVDQVEDRAGRADADGQTRTASAEKAGRLAERTDRVAEDRPTA